MAIIPSERLTIRSPFSFLSSAAAIRMSNTEASTRRKRPYSEYDQASSSLREASLREAKRSKVDSPADTPSRCYLDQLSKVWLTRRALQELDRRTRQAKPYPRSGPEIPDRPLTRGLLRELQSRLHSRDTAASAYLHHYDPARSRDLKSFARSGGPDLQDLRGYLPPVQPSQSIMSSAKSHRRYKRGKHSSKSTSGSYATATSTTITKSSRSSGAYDPNFEQRMIDNGIYPHGYKHPDGRKPPKPENCDDMHQMMAQYRASLSPSRLDEEDFDRFADAESQAISENRVIRNVIPMIQGTVRDKTCVDGDAPFTNLDNLMSGKVHSAKPDIYYGARPAQLYRDVRTELSRFIEPSTTRTRPIAPNFFVEVKGQSGSHAVLRNQAGYAGALGARGIHSLQTYGDDKPTYANNAHTISTTYHSGQLKIYAHHTAQPDGPDTDPEYYMTQLRAFALTDNLDTYKQGLTAFRNARDWTEAQRNVAIEHANAVWQSQRGTNHEGDNGEEEEEEDGEDEFVGAVPILSSFTSQSSFTPRRPNTGSALRALHEAESSPDELTLEPHELVQSSKSRAEDRQRRSKSSTKRNDTTSGTWVWQNGAFECWENQNLLQSQRTAPRDVWVYSKQPWRGSEGKHWQCYSSASRSMSYQ